MVTYHSQEVMGGKNDSVSPTLMILNGDITYEKADVTDPLGIPYIGNLTCVCWYDEGYIVDMIFVITPWLYQRSSYL